MKITKLTLLGSLILGVAAAAGAANCPNASITVVNTTSQEAVGAMQGTNHSYVGYDVRPNQSVTYTLPGTVSYTPRVLFVGDLMSWGGSVENNQVCSPNPLVLSGTNGCVDPSIKVHLSIVPHGNGGVACQLSGN